MFLRKIMRGSANKSFGIEVASLAGVPDEVTTRAKSILRKLEKNDPVKSADYRAQTLADDSQEPVRNESECERIIEDIDLDNLTPSQAFALLADLKEKLGKK